MPVWFNVVISAAIVCVVLAWRLDPFQRRHRAFLAELKVRPSLTGLQLYLQYYTVEEITPDIPGRVRRHFAKHMFYPADKLLPDDDLMFFWYEIDMIDLIRDLEKEFGLIITNRDCEWAGCTIRAVSMMVHRLLESRS